MLLLDGAYAEQEEEKAPQFHWIDSLADQEVATLVKTIAIREAVCGVSLGTSDLPTIFNIFYF
jgi:hypothetical protein